MSEGGDVEDWSEKYRPTDISSMEGNEVQLKKIQLWLDKWSENKMPKKRGILL